MIVRYEPEKKPSGGRSAAMTSRLVCLLRRDDRPLANVIPYPFPEGGYVMRTLLIVLGLCGFLLVPLPEVTYGGPAKTTQVGWASW